MEKTSGPQKQCPLSGRTRDWDLHGLANQISVAERQKKMGKEKEKQVLEYKSFSHLQSRDKNAVARLIFR